MIKIVKKTVLRLKMLVFNKRFVWSRILRILKVFSLISSVWSVSYRAHLTLFFSLNSDVFFSISVPKYHLDFQSFSVNTKIKRVYLFQILNNWFSIYNNRNNLDQRKKILFLCNFQAEFVSENRSKHSNNLPNRNIFSDRYRKIFARN